MQWGYDFNIWFQEVVSLFNSKRSFLIGSVCLAILTEYFTWLFVGNNWFWRFSQLVLISRCPTPSHSVNISLEILKFQTSISNFKFQRFARNYAQTVPFHKIRWSYGIFRSADFGVSMAIRLFHRQFPLMLQVELWTLA